MKKVVLIIVAVVCCIYVISPDPLPFVVDDVAAGLVGGASLLKAIRSFTED